jgi:predicted outer membrane repeat protein
MPNLLSSISKTGKRIIPRNNKSTTTTSSNKNRSFFMPYFNNYTVVTGISEVGENYNIPRESVMIDNSVFSENYSGLKGSAIYLKGVS